MLPDNVFGICSVYGDMWRKVVSHVPHQMLHGMVPNQGAVTLLCHYDMEGSGPPLWVLHGREGRQEFAYGHAKCGIVRARFVEMRPGQLHRLTIGWGQRRNLL